MDPAKITLSEFIIDGDSNSPCVIKQYFPDAFHSRCLNHYIISTKKRIASNCKGYGEITERVIKKCLKIESWYLSFGRQKNGIIDEMILVIMINSVQKK